MGYLYFWNGMEGKEGGEEGMEGDASPLQGGIKGPDPPVSWSLLVGALGVRRRRQISDD